MTTEQTEEILSEIRLIADRLAKLASSNPGTDDGARPSDWVSPFSFRKTTEQPATEDQLLAMVMAEYRNRRDRAHFLDSELFGEPAWDILLDLFTARLLGRRLSVSAVCIGSYVPPTTALRWITVLVDAGLAERELDESDKRRQWISLSKPGERAMRSYFVHLAQRRVATVRVR